ncbi:hypothetical protein LUZ60_017307 [Juncus effusus]|nr:hypothetical protein LUZ60_017307 [Juncus effusus]
MKGCDFIPIEPVIIFFESVLMGCFISCFRPREKNHSVRSSTSSISIDSNFLIETLVKKDRDGCVVQSEDTESKEILAEEDGLNEELRQEAKQLKLCGVITQTPVEIKKSQKRRAFQELNGSDLSPKSSQSQTASNKKIQLSAKSEQENQCEKQISSLKENTPAIESFLGSNEGKKKGPKLDITPAQHSAKFQVKLPNNKSPFPTPLTLRDEMETPLTQHPSYMETPRTGKRARIRAQYIFPASKQLEISSEKQMEISSDVKTGEQSGSFTFGAERKEEETPKVSVASLSEWLKPVSNWAVWNGIPNSTTKYKEDQKVKWHATPFEERLEKVLSEEKNHPRKLVSKRLIELEE